MKRRDYTTSIPLKYSSVLSMPLFHLSDKFRVPGQRERWRFWCNEVIGLFFLFLSFVFESVYSPWYNDRSMISGYASKQVYLGKKKNHMINKNLILRSTRCTCRLYWIKMIISGVFSRININLCIYFLN